MRLPLILALLAAAPAAAQQTTSSEGPEAVAVTIYRDPNRPADHAMQLNWLNGYALISERRRVAIPAGDGEIRFESVAGGILPESAIVTDLPGGVIEKNQDAWLLSPASLIERSLGRRVTLRRTSLATGAVREHEAIVRSSPDGAVVLQTGDGFEALRCSGLPETVVYDRVPEGLSAKPTLSVRTRSERALEADVTLSYLASGFDWQANYVGTLSAGGDRLDLFAWVTLANGDETSFADADTQAIAGRVNRQQTYRQRPTGQPLNLRCWPSDTTTSNLPVEQSEALAEDIVVTGMRMMAPAPPPPPPPAAPAMQAQQEDLGDLKLYRIPEKVTVAAQSQKQVAMLEKRGVAVSSVYRRRLGPFEEQGPVAAARILKTRNRMREGLGLPLPAGRVVLFSAGAARPIMIGEGSIDDKAVGEDVEISAGDAPGVITKVTRVSGDEKSGAYTLTVSNDRPYPIMFESELSVGGWGFSTEGAKLAKRNGLHVWSIVVPANGTRILRYMLTRPR